MWATTVGWRPLPTEQFTVHSSRFTVGLLGVAHPDRTGAAAKPWSAAFPRPRDEAVVSKGEMALQALFVSALYAATSEWIFVG